MKVLPDNECSERGDEDHIQSNSSFEQSHSSSGRTKSHNIFTNRKSKEVASRILLLHKKNAVRHFLVYFAFSVSFSSILAAFIFSSKSVMQNIYGVDFILVAAGKNIQYYDEVLTMSARMAVFTGEIFWVQRYMEYIEPIDAEIKAVQKMVPDIADIFFQSTDLANQRLVELETKALDIVSSNTSNKNLTLAQSLLLSSEYNEYKTVLSEGLQLLEERINQHAANKHSSLDTYSLVAVVITCILLCFSVCLGMGMMWMIKRHSKEEEQQLFRAMIRYYNTNRKNVYKQPSIMS
mmetsp:Transcript_10776/g.14043  ORF Transcript_10776/g.14043 Transcript_10776/m.14043 type:complete len:293 (+) Transcript_10776:2-880(+)